MKNTLSKCLLSNQSEFKFQYAAYLVKYPNYFDFSILELKSLMEMHNIPYYLNDDNNHNVRFDPFLRFKTKERLNEKVINELYQRAVLLKNIFQVYSKSNSFTELVSNVKSIKESNEENDLKSEIESNEFFKFMVEGCDKSFTKEEQKEMMEGLDFLQFKAAVNLSKASRVFVIYYNKPTDEYYFGKIIGEIPKGQCFYIKYDLNKRKYLGPTSLDNRLSFIMANLGKITSGDVVYDPFAGTGSILIPCSHFK